MIPFQPLSSSSPLLQLPYPSARLPMSPLLISPSVLLLSLPATIHSFPAPHLFPSSLFTLCSSSHLLQLPSSHPAPLHLPSLSLTFPSAPLLYLLGLLPYCSLPAPLPFSSPTIQVSLQLPSLSASHMHPFRLQLPSSTPPLQSPPLPNSSSPSSSTSNYPPIQLLTIQFPSPPGPLFQLPSASAPLPFSGPPYVPSPHPPSVVLPSHPASLRYFPAHHLFPSSLSLPYFSALFSSSSFSLPHYLLVHPDPLPRAPFQLPFPSNYPLLQLPLPSRFLPLTFSSPPLF